MAAPTYDDDVEKALTKVMSQNSALMKQARTQGLQGAQQVGLGQSTMGIQAAQAAALNAAMPIASQQAQQAHQKNIQGAQFGHETAQQQALFGHQTGMQREQFGHESGMQKAGFQHASSESALDRAQQTKQLWDSGYLDRLKMHEGASLDRHAQDLQRNFEAQQNAEQRSMQERIAAMEISAADRERAASAFSSIENAYAAMFAQIGSNENLPGDVREAYVRHAGNIRNSNINMISSLYRASGQIPW